MPLSALAKARARDQRHNERDYWRRKLSAKPYSLAGFPDDNRSVPTSGAPRAQMQIEIRDELARRLLTAASSSDYALFTLLLAVLRALLYRYSGRKQQIIGTTVFQREFRPKLLNSVLLLAGSVNGTLSGRVLLNDSKQLLLEARRQQNFPLVEALEFLSQHCTLSDIEVLMRLDSLQHADYCASLQPAMMFNFLRHESSLTLKLEYDSRRYSLSYVECLLDHFQSLAEALLHNTDCKLARFPILRTAEEERIRAVGDGAAEPFHAALSLPALIDEHAESQPDAPALRTTLDSFSYRQLRTLSQELARRMQGLGVGPERGVLLLGDRSPAFIIAALAVLRSGGFYLPLAADTPPERLRAIIEDIRPALIMCDPARRAKLPPFDAVVLDLELQNFEAGDTNTPSGLPTIRLEQAAYAIYTSGSTGRPKGVLVTHASLLNLIAWHHKEFKLCASDRTTWLANVAFDASVWEIWPGLAAGACITIVDESIKAEAETLRDFILSQRITHSFVPTVLAELMLSLEWPATSALRYLLTGGDRLCRRPERALPFRLVNNYGPTEATVVASSGPVEQGSAPDKDISIGRPIANLRAYILDEDLQLRPFGLSGELYLGGAGLARGYHAAPAQTAAAFLPDPFSTRPGERMYRSGDLASLRDDATLMFHGRRDRQLSIHGQRLELAEIEAVLRGFDGIREALVRAVDNRIEAFLLPEQSAPDPSANPTLLQRYLRERLPAYMIPVSFTTLAALPLSANGKLDYAQLPQTQQSDRDKAAAFVAARSEEEALLAALCGELLNLPQVSVNANFFEMGGDSITSIQLVSRLKQVGWRLKPWQVFESQTIAALAPRLQRIEAQTAAAEPFKGRSPLSPIQHWHLEHNLPTLHHFNQAVLISVPLAIETAALEAALRQLLRHNDALRLRLEITDAAPCLRYDELDPKDILEIVDLDALESADWQSAMATHADACQRSLDVCKGPILRCVLYRSASARQARFLLLIHHMAVDGVSWRLILDQLSRAYAAALAGEAQPLQGAADASFHAWTSSLAQQSAGRAFDDELNYWLDPRRRDSKRLPLDFDARPELNTYASSANVACSLPAAATEWLLRHLLASTSLRIEEALIAALLHSISRWCGAERLLLDMESHGREDSAEMMDLSSTVGWFTALYPVFFEWKAGAGMLDLAGSVQAGMAAVPHYGIGYGALRYQHPDSKIREQLPAMPPAQINFNYLGQFGELLALAGDWQFAEENSGEHLSPAMQRGSLIDVGCTIAGGILNINWNYSDKFHRRQTIEKLAAWHLEALQDLIADAGRKDMRATAPSSSA